MDWLSSMAYPVLGNPGPAKRQMSDDDHGSHGLSTLPTKLEEDFIAPLTAIRGVLEILRDYPDIEPAEQAKFVASALDECARIEHGLRDLGAAVYGADRSTPAADKATRLRLDPARELAELDFSSLDFDNSNTVNEIFDDILEQIIASGRRWWFLVDYTDCHVFPEAWIAFAHRGKEIRVKYGYGTIRFAANGQGGLPDRAEALEQIEAAKQAMA